MENEDWDRETPRSLAMSGYWDRELGLRVRIDETGIGDVIRSSRRVPNALRPPSPSPRRWEPLLVRAARVTVWGRYDGQRIVTAADQRSGFSVFLFLFLF